MGLKCGKKSDTLLAVYTSHTILAYCYQAFASYSIHSCRTLLAHRQWPCSYCVYIFLWFSSFFSCCSSVLSYFISYPINLRFQKTHPPPLPEVSHQATTPFFQSFICYVPFLLSTVHPVIPYSNRNGRSLLTH